MSTCLTVAHAVVSAVARPARHVAHHAIGRVVRHARPHRPVVAAPRPRPGVECVKPAGALPAGPAVGATQGGLASGAGALVSGTIGAASRLAAAAALAAGLAAGGAGLAGSGLFGGARTAGAATEMSADRNELATFDQVVLMSIERPFDTSALSGPDRMAPLSSAVGGPTSGIEGQTVALSTPIDVPEPSSLVLLAFAAAAAARCSRGRRALQ